jgi:hypothetical protein
VVDVDDPLPTIVDELIVGADGTELMLLPLSTLGGGIFIPVGAAQQVKKAIAVHVEERDAFSVVGAERMGEESYSWLPARSSTRVLHAKLGGVRGILGMTRPASKERQSEEWRNVFRWGLHGGAPVG